MSVFSTVTHIVRRNFVSGVLVVVPLILTYIVLRFMFEAVDGILKPVLMKLFEYYVPGLGILTTLLLIILAGFFTRSFLGSKIYGLGEKLLARMPIIRPIYSSAKQLLEAVAMPSVKSFKEVVLIEYPRRGVYALCFVSKTVTIVNREGGHDEFATVFVPSTPTPVSGMVIMVPISEIFHLEMSVEDGVKFLVSGGVASPDLIKNRSVAATNENGEVIK